MLSSAVGNIPIDSGLLLEHPAEVRAWLTTEGIMEASINTSNGVMEEQGSDKEVRGR